MVLFARPPTPVAVAALLLVSILLPLPLGAATPSAASGEGGARQLLARVADAYAVRSAYSDRGTLEVRRPGQAVERWSFVTVAAGGALRFDLQRDDGAGRRVVWGDAAGAALWDAAAGSRELPSLRAALAGLLAEGGPQALVVPLLLSGGDAGLRQPAAAALEGTEPCAAAEPCRVVALAPLGGTAETRLWVEPGSLAVRRVETLLWPPPAPGADAAAPTVIALELIPGPPPDGAAAAFVPPAPAPEAASAEPPQGVFGDTIEVTLASLVVRVVDDAGEPVPGLAAGDFRVTAGRGRDRRELPVVAVDWVAPGEAPASRSRHPPGAVGGSAAEPGRVVVLFVQAALNASRVRGHLKLLPAAEELLAELHPDDRVAVVAFDSHLKLWQDLTRDRTAVSAALDRAVRFGGRPAGRRGDGPGLGESPAMAPRRAMEIATPEAALAAVGRALGGLPGDKAVVWIGWGLGRFDRGGVRLGSDYSRAVAELAAAEAAVFVLDVADAAYHTLELGLEQVAADTGGTYAKTHTFAGREVRRLARTLAGHYRLSLDVSGPGEVAAGGELRVELISVRGRVLHRRRLPPPGRRLD